MLTLVGRTLQEHGPMTPADVARRVGADETAVRGMLDVWRSKGRVVRERSACGGCTSCGVAESYRWVDESDARMVIGPVARGQRRAMIGR
jgi:predicted ArsR family transcriptional regulator